MHPQFLRQRHNVVALLQAGDGVLLERLWKFAHTFLGHLPPPLGVKCANSPCLNLGVQSNAGERAVGMVTSEGVDGHLAHIQGKAVRYWLAWIAGRDPGTLFLLQHVHIHRASPERRGGKLLSPGVESGGGPQLLLLWLPLTPVAQLSSYGAPATSVFPAIASPLRLRGGRRRISATSP